MTVRSRCLRAVRKARQETVRKTVVRRRWSGGASSAARGCADGGDALPQRRRDTLLPPSTGCHAAVETKRE